MTHPGIVRSSDFKLNSFLLAALLFSATLIHSQPARLSKEKIDRRVENISSAEPATLAARLIEGCNYDWEKVRAIYSWITDNIEYQVRVPRNRGNTSATEDTSNATLDERVSVSVINKGMAICEGYSRLFKTLCGYAGIEAEIVHGFARGGRNPQRFSSNHTWNAVFIDNEWKLLDVTWASGYVNRRGEIYVRERDEQYFLPAPDKFILDHYPDNPQWTLLNDLPRLPEFRQSPFRQRSFAKYQQLGFSPSKGTIEATPGELIEIVLESKDVRRDHQIGSDPFLDTAAYQSSASVLLQPAEVHGNKFYYRYNANDKSVQWIYILYNNDIVLRYHLQFK
jgi:Transglutaminase-like superfamily